MFSLSTGILAGVKFLLIKLQRLQATTMEEEGLVFVHTKISKIHSGVSTEKSRRDRAREITEDQERQRKLDNRTAEETEKES